jgi:copper chaperone CopZ
MTKVTYQIPDMHCSSCAMSLEGIEDELEGIQKIRASYRKQTLDIEFDEKKVTAKKIRQAIIDLGYTPQ